MLAERAYPVGVRELARREGLRQSEVSVHLLAKRRESVHGPREPEQAEVLAPPHLLGIAFKPRKGVDRGGLDWHRRVVGAYGAIKLAVFRRHHIAAVWRRRPCVDAEPRF